MSRLCFESFKFLLPCFLWLFAGFDLILIPLFAAELGRLYFPSYNPQNSILAVYGTFSLSLLMRVFGGMYFGRLSDIYGRKAVIMICSWFLTIIMIISAYLPSDYTNNMDVISPAILFVITRILIGFFVGGLWPTAAILAMENLHWSKFVHYNDKWKQWNNDFENKVKRLTFQSSILQVWLFLGYFISVVVLINYGHQLATFFYSHFFSSIPQYNDFPLWRSMSLIAGFIGLVLIILCRKYLNESIKWKEWNEERKKWMEKKQRRAELELYRPGFTSLLKNKKYREILFSFWLIMTGLMYMYYSTIITAPELFLRDGSLTPNFFLVLLITMALAHIWVGILCHLSWKRLDRSHSSKFFRFIYKIFFSLENFLTFKNVFQDIFLKLIESPKKETKINGTNKDVWKIDDLDVRLITNLSLALIPIGGFGCIFFIFQPGNNSGFYTTTHTVILPSIVILVANAAWAFIPSMLSSRFPIHLRSTGASLAYNGGLVIGFACPFIIIDFYLQFKSEYVIFVAMILGAVSIVVGGLRLMRIINQK
jgi:MFS family permease